MMSQNPVYVFGLEHLHTSVEEARALGYNMFEGYIENEAYKIPEAPYDGFYILNFLEHVPTPKEFLKGIAANLKDEAYGLVEVPNGDFIIKNQMFSEFMLDHLSYFTKETLSLALGQSGFVVESCKVIWNEYIISAVVRKRNGINTVSFALRQDRLLRALDLYLDGKAREQKRVAVWGAGHQALAIMALANMQEKILCVIDSAKFKQNRYTPSTHIPIYAPDKIRQLKIDTIIVMAGSYSKEVCEIIQNTYHNIDVEIIDKIVEQWG